MLRHPRLLELAHLFKERHPGLLKHIAPADKSFVGYNGRRLLAVCNKEKTEDFELHARRKRIPQSLWHPLSIQISLRAPVYLQSKRAAIHSSVPPGGIEYARSLDFFARLKPADLLRTSKADLVARTTRSQVAG